MKGYPPLMTQTAAIFSIVMLRRNKSIARNIAVKKKRAAVMKKKSMVVKRKAKMTVKRKAKTETIKPAKVEMTTTPGKP